MRGIATPFGLSYVPGQWLESIQVSKCLSTVVNGVESITGQINTEYRKPTDEKPLFVNLSACVIVSAGWLLLCVIGSAGLAMFFNVTASQ